MTTWALIPVKRFADAKQRLSSCLNETQRAGISRAMLEDVLHAVMMSDGIDGVLVVGDEPELATLRRCHGFEWMSEAQPGAGLNAALSHAMAVLAVRGVRDCCILHADLPLARPEGIEQLLAAHAATPRGTVTLVPDRARSGTNAMVCGLPPVLLPAFGGGSYARHRQLAEQAGCRVNVFHSDGLALDIDNRADLLCLRRHYRITDDLASTTTALLLNDYANTSDNRLPDAELPRRTA